MPRRKQYEKKAPAEKRMSPWDKLKAQHAEELRQESERSYRAGFAAGEAHAKKHMGMPQSLTNTLEMIQGIVGANAQLTTSAAEMLRRAGEAK